MNLLPFAHSQSGLAAPNVWPTTTSTNVGCDHREEEPISSDGAKACSVGVCRCDGHGSRARYCSEYDQREYGVGDSVEEIENLERAEPLCSCDDEAGYGRA